MVRPLFRGAWMSALFIHYQIEPERLQREVPFRLDVREGKAYVSVVPFSQEKLRFAFGGRMTNSVGRLFANHEFLNVRTYVRHGGESGIFFLAEWVPKRVATWLGPPMFGLPCRLGKIEYDHTQSLLRGKVACEVGCFTYCGSCSESWNVCKGGSLDEFLLERYVAFTEWHGLRRKFYVTHEPWPQTRAEVTVEGAGLLRTQFRWWPDAELVFANFSPGVNAVTISRPRRVRTGRDDDEDTGDGKQWIDRIGNH